MSEDPFERVVNDGGDPRLCAEKCTTCLFRPGRMTRGMRRVVTDARERNSYVMCHETYQHSDFRPQEDVEPAMCRGYWDSFKDEQYGLQIMDKYDMYEEVPAPPPDPKQSRYRMVGEHRGQFIVAREDGE